MNLFLWIVASLLAIAFLGAGAMKLTQPREKLAASGMGWTEDFSPRVVKTIGALEVLAGIGLILPPALDMAPVLAPVAGIGLVLLMLGAAATHLRRKETPMIGANAVLIALALVVVWGRLSPQPF
ncbi:MAG TPA: DoxX family protein [Actinomycetota bacterium]|nr:DoxX family protein [Actinomycetota bacterium]